MKTPMESEAAALTSAHQPQPMASSSKTPVNSNGDATHTTPQIPQLDPTFAAWSNNQLRRVTLHTHPATVQFLPKTMSMERLCRCLTIQISAGNPYASYLPQAQSYSWATTSRAPSSTSYAKHSKPDVKQATPKTPPFPEPETYKHWEEVVKKFLVRAKFMQTLKGLENDMLVLNAGWEQEVIPEALAEMVKGLQVSSFVANLAVSLIMDDHRPCSTGLQEAKGRRHCYGYHFRCRYPVDKHYER